MSAISCPSTPIWCGSADLDHRRLEAWVIRRKDRQSLLVTDGNFTYVSIDDRGHPQAIQRDGATIAT